MPTVGLLADNPAARAPSLLLRPMTAFPSAPGGSTSPALRAGGRSTFERAAAACAAGRLAGGAANTYSTLRIINQTATVLSVSREQVLTRSLRAALAGGVGALCRTAVGRHVQVVSSTEWMCMHVQYKTKEDCGADALPSFADERPVEALGHDHVGAALFLSIYSTSCNNVAVTSDSSVQFYASFVIGILALSEVDRLLFKGSVALSTSTLHALLHQSALTRRAQVLDLLLPIILKLGGVHVPTRVPYSSQVDPYVMISECGAL